MGAVRFSAEMCDDANRGEIKLSAIFQFLTCFGAGSLPLSFSKL
jgi:hypothetical protein